MLYVLIYYIVGYRKAVVVGNLKNSFPDYSDQQIKMVTKKYYRYLCDLLLEALKTITWEEKDVKKRVKMYDVEMVDSLYDKGKSVLIVMGHLGNWEWAGPCFNLHCKHNLFVVYHPLSNPYFEKVFQGSRTKFNTGIIPRVNTLREMIANRKALNATALIADQAPTPINAALWVDFLNQDTPVFNGPEKLAKKLDQAVVYMRVVRVRRGYYEVRPKLLAEFPKDAPDQSITKAFINTLEQDICEQPEAWLWSHRRWKHKRPSN